MTRPFRLEEDERRYFALRSEFFIRLVQSGVPAQTVHEIMRNFGKLEDMMFFEGLHQGMATAILTPRVGEDRYPIWCHAELYGDAATPLRRVEEAQIEVLDADETHEPLEDHPWMPTEPMQFGPLTLTEAVEQYGEDLVVKRAPVRAREQAVVQPAPDADAVDDPMSVLEELADGADPAEVFARRGIEAPDAEGMVPQGELQELIELPVVDEEQSDESERPLHQPQLLDRARDVLLRSTPPATWTDLVLLLMRELRVDAGHIDQVMSTPMGMTVISQCNLFHLHPGAMPEVKAVPAPTR